MSKSPNNGAAASAKKVTQAFAGLAVLTLAAGGGLVFWLNGQIGACQAAAASKEAEVGSSEQVTKRLDTTKATYDQVNSRIAVLEASVSEKSFVPTLLQQLQTLAAQTHLTVASVQPSAISTPAPPPPPPKSADGGSGGGGADGTAKKKPAPPPYDTMNVNLSVVGTYADTVTFLYDLTRFPKIISVESAQFNPGSAPAAPKGASASPPVTTQLKLTAFVFHQDDSAPTAPDTDAAVKTAGAAAVPPPAAPTVAGAAGRAAQGAVAATRAANSRSQGAASTL